MIHLRRYLGWSAVTLLPALLLGGMLSRVLPDPHRAVPTFHFYIVTMTSLVAIGLAVLMAVAAGQLRDARIFFMALAFFGMAGIFMVHALTTPGAMMQHNNPWVGFSAYASLLIGAVFLALSTVEWRPQAQRAIIANQARIVGLILILLLGYAAVALVSSAMPGDPGPPISGYALAPDEGAGEYGPASGHGDMVMPLPSAAPDQQRATAEYIPFSFLGDKALAQAIAASTIGLLLLVIVRYSQLYRLTRLPLLAGFLAAAILLVQAQAAMLLGTVWHASWWLYHLLMLLALFAAIGGMAVEYANSGTLRGVVEGLLLRDTIARLQSGYTDVIVALVGAVEAKDPYTRGHTQRVAALSVLIGQELRLSSERLRILSQAAMLHDIGKIGVPDSILNKLGALTDEEFAIIKDHPARGHEIIKGVRSLQQEIGGVRHHQERLDGSGYPDGLVGEEIPLEARIIAVADVFDALTSTRSYRAAWSPERALAVLDQEAGSKLDPRCVQAIHRVLALQPAPQGATSANGTTASTRAEQIVTPPVLSRG